MDFTMFPVASQSSASSHGSLHRSSQSMRESFRDMPRSSQDIHTVISPDASLPGAHNVFHSSVGITSLSDMEKAMRQTYHQSASGGPSALPSALHSTYATAGSQVDVSHEDVNPTQTEGPVPSPDQSADGEQTVSIRSNLALQSPLNISQQNLQVLSMVEGPDSHPESSAIAGTSEHREDVDNLTSALNEINIQSQELPERNVAPSDVSAQANPDMSLLGSRRHDTEPMSSTPIEPASIGPNVDREAVSAADQDPTRNPAHSATGQNVAGPPVYAWHSRSRQEEAPPSNITSGIPNRPEDDMPHVASISSELDFSQRSAAADRSLPATTTSAASVSGIERDYWDALPLPPSPTSQHPGRAPNPPGAELHQSSPNISDIVMPLPSDLSGMYDSVPLPQTLTSSDQSEIALTSLSQIPGVAVRDLPLFPPSESGLLSSQQSHQSHLAPMCLRSSSYDHIRVSSPTYLPSREFSDPDLPAYHQAVGGSPEELIPHEHYHYSYHTHRGVGNPDPPAYHQTLEGIQEESLPHEHYPYFYSTHRDDGHPDLPAYHQAPVHPSYHTLRDERSDVTEKQSQSMDYHQLIRRLPEYDPSCHAHGEETRLKENVTLIPLVKSQQSHVLETSETTRHEPLQATDECGLFFDNAHNKYFKLPFRNVHGFHIGKLGTSIYYKDFGEGEFKCDPYMIL